MTELERLVAAARCGDLETVRSIVAANAALINEKDSTGATPLHYAAFGGHRGVVRFLVERGAAVNARDDRYGATATGWAVEYLRELGGYTAAELEDFAYAIECGDARWVRRFLARFPALREAEFKDGATFRQLAAGSPDGAIARFFGNSEPRS